MVLDFRYDSNCRQGEGQHRDNTSASDELRLPNVTVLETLIKTGAGGVLEVNIFAIFVFLAFKSYDSITSTFNVPYPGGFQADDE